jgi:hypothetical protein
MPVLNPDHLLDQADRLIAPPGGGAPRQTDLRRAISNAYYSLFHAILAEASDDFVGRTKRQTPRYSLVYRSMDHAPLRGLCNVVTSEDYKKNRKLPPKYVLHEPAGGFGSDLIEMATAFSDLQEKRHLADYDPLYRVRMSDALLAVATARTALERFRNANVQKRRAFISLAVFKPR